MGGGNKRGSVGGNILQTPRPASSHSVRGTPSSRCFKNESGAQSTAKRALDIANLPVKNYSFNGRESEPALLRRPFSPICRANGDYYSDKQNIPQEQQQTVLKNKKIVTNDPPLPTTSKTIPLSDDENCIPKVTLVTPAPQEPPLHDSDSQEEETADDCEEEIEYSFEEICDCLREYQKSNGNGNGKGKGKGKGKSMGKEVALAMPTMATEEATRRVRLSSLKYISIIVCNVPNRPSVD